MGKDRQKCVSMTGIAAAGPLQKMVLQITEN